MKKPSKPLHARGELRSAIRRQPVVFAVYLVLRLIVLASLVSAILRQEYESAFVCVLVLFLFIMLINVVLNRFIKKRKED